MKVLMILCLLTAVRKTDNRATASERVSIIQKKKKTNLLKTSSPNKKFKRLLEAMADMF